MHFVGTACSSAISEEDFLVRQEDLSLSRRNIYHRLDFKVTVKENRTYDLTSNNATPNIDFPNGLMIYFSQPMKINLCPITKVPSINKSTFKYTFVRK